MRLIDLDSLLLELEGNRPEVWIESDIIIGEQDGYDYATTIVEGQSIIDPVKHGKWEVDGIWDRCSVCNRLVLQPHINGNGTFYYCPNCGAYMRGDKDETD